MPHTHNIGHEKNKNFSIEAFWAKRLKVSKEIAVKIY